MWRLAPSGALSVLMIEATNTHYTLPDRGLLGPHAFFDPAMLETPHMDDGFRAHQALEGDVRVEIKNGRLIDPMLPWPLDQVAGVVHVQDGRVKVEEKEKITAVLGPARIDLTLETRDGPSEHGI